MAISMIQSYLVPPGKNLESPPDIVGALIPLSGRLFEMLNIIYERAERECIIQISFRKSEENKQDNNVQNLFISYYNNQTQEMGLPIAERLRGYTTNKSKLGLLFLISGTNQIGDKKLFVSRFPAEEGVIADIDSNQLRVEFIERIFMKSSKLYKAALYCGTNLHHHFWSGYAIDKQINSSNNEIAQYWIQDFLKSEYKTSSKQGSAWFAQALKEATKSARSVLEKRLMISLGSLMSGYDKNIITIVDILDNSHLSPEIKDLIISKLPDKDIAEISFEFDSREFYNEISYRSVELDNNGILTAPSEEFDNCFERTPIDGKKDKYRYTTEGKIVDEKYRGRK